MYQKLVNGEYGLKATFWKFGVMWMLILNVLSRVFAGLLAKSTSGYTIIEFYSKHFHPIYSGKMNIFWTLCYLSSLLIIILYSFAIIKAVWKSSAEYDKSLWLRYLARLFILGIVAVVLSNLKLSQFF